MQNLQSSPSSSPWHFCLNIFRGWLERHTTGGKAHALQASMQLFQPTLVQSTALQTPALQALCGVAPGMLRGQVLPGNKPRASMCKASATPLSYIQDITVPFWVGANCLQVVPFLAVLNLPGCSKVLLGWGGIWGTLLNQG